jgi:hypothetical protein
MPNKEKPFHILVDQRPHEWQEPFITGVQIKQLAGVDASYGVWLNLPGPEDPMIADDQAVDLRVPGVEKFFTGRRATTEG